ncbi:MFS general substrate transporter [Amylostereum chailletii]|nr:MFS general substrate transporter [Amylostereum chailletii]
MSIVNEREKADETRPPSLTCSTLHDREDRFLEKEREDIPAAVEPPELGSGKFDDFEFPDGGVQAWTVIFGAACVTFTTFGYVNTWGSFQDYYATNTLKDTSPSTIAWIGSIQYALVFLPGLVVGRLFDIGFFKIPLFVATVILVVCTFLTAECKEYWQFLLCQGFGVGLSSGIIFGPTMGIVGHWFKKRRSTALGIIAVGSSTGGTLFPIMFRNLTVVVGFKWTMRIFGFIILLFLGISNVVLKRRLPPTVASGGLVDFRQFKNPAFSLYSAAGFISFLGLYTMLTYVNASGRLQGVDEDLSPYLVAIANAGSGAGRLISGLLADRVGGLNIMTPFTALAGIFTIIWPFVHGKGPVIVITLLYGFTSGAYVGLLAGPIMAMGPTEDVGRRTGMYFTVTAMGALAGPPISGAIIDATGNYKAVGLYAGIAVLIAVVFMTLSRYFALGGWRGKV